MEVVVCYQVHTGAEPTFRAGWTLGHASIQRAIRSHESPRRNRVTVDDLPGRLEDEDELLDNCVAPLGLGCA